MNKHLTNTKINKNPDKLIYVYMDWDGLSMPQLMGNLSATMIRGREVFSFTYNNEWLKEYAHCLLDPHLQMFEGLQYPIRSQNNFGVFLDSTPDRFGRVLMDRRARLLNKNTKLFESDYLLGVYDGSRIGGLRFKLNPEGQFLDDNSLYASPPFASLGQLEAASLALEQDHISADDYKKWLQLLVVPGSSLGGARPKASVVDARQHLWIAKFPSRYDEVNIGAWEFVVHGLAKKSGIITSMAKIKQFNSQHHTFLTKRFDRTENNQRIHFTSAMTLLQHVDGDGAKSGASYLELAEFIIANGANPDQDLEQLWRRIVFYICVSNVDDHLRNHGFILNPLTGWRLSPAYDINPVAGGNGLNLNINEHDNAQDLSLALEIAPYFRVTKKFADKIVSEIVTGVKTWQRTAKQLGISRKEMDNMARAFRVADNY